MEYIMIGVDTASGESQTETVLWVCCPVVDPGKRLAFEVSHHITGERADRVYAALLEQTK